ncbi:hypothetical protein UFOVP695_24 [uncultured Caudovirales phage]|uniref:Uncharacterized protein n=1 Tax=uncultured Caudovirales phage TaxID=2100421 RepID=A0A6J5NEJ5_9CAUD|nr:hypothetical protein UFOVP695_24 [uncultured Caudovirales phage]
MKSVDTLIAEAALKVTTIFYCYWFMSKIYEKIFGYKDLTSVGIGLLLCIVVSFILHLKNLKKSL